jgi:hypothetical protein
MMNQTFEKAWSQIVAKAWSDELFKKRLLADPAAVLKEHGIELPTEVAVKVVEDSAKVVHLILPNPPVELSEEEMNQVAGGTLVPGGLLTVGDDAQLANVDMQNCLQKQQQTMQMMSNISKLTSDTMMSVIRKIGG